ncbi:7-carboxy-7-deazaguanine synthase QueE [Cryobacterium sp.]|uniref:7-carboxy-7-deazaguanine synthase QueE n=1 Tax=Cryobacterium sp. TaxID=1926290 RepID=UPI002609E81D|nr:7-carboxy-7-deazaguanine synthase QueE [Cryobacterium sp.]MCU1445027.1 7-carboxy-7-deazaguanine synthase QueE [Cryobacterium sp.]
MGNAERFGSCDSLILLPSLIITEVFTSVQGEGPSVGQPAVFLRLAMCNLACSWCDTPYSWDWKRYDRDAETKLIDVEGLADRLTLDLQATRLLIITGGEPLIQQRDLAALLEIIRARVPDVRFEVETNGTLAPAPSLAALVQLFVVSPKLGNSGLNRRVRVKNEALVEFEQRGSVLKFVIAAPEDVTEASAIATEAGFSPERVWLMPEGTDTATILAGMNQLAPVCIDLGFNLSTRLHVLLWGDTRGT